ncbi:hypothetical protein RHSIM_Rhsim11G0172100 [Rhododendron simsii]|uniref:Uncharacterized protein n=1 Tax=Rhododendron simsii TaxID=118357 RepID=A0A834LAX1_RHOSS|nr:hypothetical protein RHSIM_Rhsim11G0172100 [Rhododendron simsii]
MALHQYLYPSICTRLGRERERNSTNHECFDGANCDQESGCGGEEVEVLDAFDGKKASTNPPAAPPSHSSAQQQTLPQSKSTDSPKAS